MESKVQRDNLHRDHNACIKKKKKKQRKNKIKQPVNYNIMAKR